MYGRTDEEVPGASKEKGRGLTGQDCSNPRGENERTDHLAKAALVEHMILPDKVLSFVQFSPLIHHVDIKEVSSKSNWIAPLVSYLKNGTLPDNKEATRKLKVQAA